MRSFVSLVSWRAVFLIALAATLLTGCADEEPDFPPGSDILLVTVDTLRADHLSAYGYPRKTSPTLDRLAAEGVRFELPIVQWPKTGPSFASMLTSTYPKDNGIVRQIGIPVPEEMTLLAERLSEAGYATRAVVSNGALSREFGFHQGFEEYLESWRDPENPEATPIVAAPDTDPNGATRVTDLALHLADRLTTERASQRESERRPFFLWVHYIDPHFPYSPPPEFADLFQNDEHWEGEPKIRVTDRPRQQMAGIGYRQVLDNRTDLAFYVARYDAEIVYTDREIARLLAGLEERGLADRRLTVMTSDHGESLGEHYFYFDHGRFGFQTCLRVPLIFHYPDVLDPQVVSEPTPLIDLSPTLLQVAGLLGQDETGWMSGRSLTTRLVGSRDGESKREVIFAEAGTATDQRWQRIATDGRFKLLLARTHVDQQWLAGVGQDRVLYDLDADPGETADVSKQHPKDFRRLDSALRRWLRSPSGLERKATEGQEMDEETRRQLEALGYL